MQITAKFQFIEQFPTVILRNAESYSFLDEESRPLIPQKGKGRDPSLRKQGFPCFLLNDDSERPFGLSYIVPFHRSSALFSFLFFTVSAR